MKYRFEKCFNSDLYVAKEVVGEAIAFLRTSIPSICDEQAADLRLVFCELLMNAVIHGNQSDNNKTVSFSIEVEGERVFCKVVDQGEGFDYRAVVKPTSNDDMMSEHGRGVRLAYNMTDMLYFNANGSEIKFYKRLVSDE